MYTLYIYIYVFKSSLLWKINKYLYILKFYVGKGNFPALNYIDVDDWYADKKPRILWKVGKYKAKENEQKWCIYKE